MYLLKIILVFVLPSGLVPPGRGSRMKVTFKLDGMSWTVPNISIDQNGLPLVGGVHPFCAGWSVCRGELNIMMTKSDVWFKTLAVDTIYIDCNRR